LNCPQTETQPSPEIIELSSNRDSTISGDHSMTSGDH
jgi:hypothetical protein